MVMTWLGGTPLWHISVSLGMKLVDPSIRAHTFIAAVYSRVSYEHSTSVTARPFVKYLEIYALFCIQDLLTIYSRHDAVRNSITRFYCVKNGLHRLKNCNQVVTNAMILSPFLVMYQFVLLKYFVSSNELPNLSSGSFAILN